MIFKIIICGMLCSTLCSAQLGSFFFMDSLIIANNVKTRTNFRMINGAVTSKAIDYYAKEGRITKTEDWSKCGEWEIKTTNWSKERDCLVRETVYNYDGNGKLYNVMSIIWDKKKYLVFSHNVYFNTDTIITYYQYNSAGKLIREYENDSRNLLYRESLYNYYPLSKQIRYFDESGNITLEIRESFDDEKFMVERVMTLHQVNLPESNWTEEAMNTINSNGRLVESKFTTNDCSGRTKFRYYKNGLLKSAASNKCFSDLKFQYEYY